MHITVLQQLRNRDNLEQTEPMREGLMAESVGFEPTVPLRAHTISSRAQSSTLATLRGEPNGRMESSDPFVAVSKVSGGESGIRI